MDGKLEAQIQVQLAGFAAEELLVGRRPQHYERRLKIVLPHFTCNLPSEEYQGCDEFKAISMVLQLGCPARRPEIVRELDTYYSAAQASLLSVWAAVQSVAKALLRSKQLDRRSFLASLGAVDIYGPVFAVQRQHGFMPDILGE